MSRNRKSPEIVRLQSLLAELGETPASLETKTGIAARTINNCIWGDQPLGGRLLRALAEQFGVSIDWLVMGRGAMFAGGESAPAPGALLPFFETVDLSTVQDFWWLAARCAEESLRQSGATPGVDYSYLDLYRLAQPLVAEKFGAGELSLVAHEAAG
ncbi:helix-turn-helix transcriptional regulator [Methylomonas sp. EFPC3]|uniref:helix-turn-helix domain-containing protein n=1 Tax=Methylomonas sp. EFPC3 TaxID=3021710 RepID=UPI002416FA47|nr:helix-turn-helix transcriptional regulator [Methylomonas sp. EFPC3]WFP48549.1 helix-turn-helix transcriptional regulator [Methylomonas sp. EFPC3]